MSGSRLFRYSRWDALNVAVIPLHIGFFLWLALEYRHLPEFVLLALLPVLLAVSLQNAGANHNHYHTPFFRARWLNTLTRVGFSMTASPKTPYNIGHGVHHATPHSWNDSSILQILGLHRPLHRQLLAFAQYVVDALGVRYLVLLYLLRRWPVERLAAFAAPGETDIATRVFEKIRHGDKLREVMLDLAAWIAFRILLCAIDWKFFFCYFVPAAFVVDTMRLAENYLQHWGATDPYDAKRDSVSSYGRIYNLLTFNLGYHQEHHYRPGMHWLQLPTLRSALPVDRRTVPFTHYINLPVIYPAFAARLRERVRGEAAVDAPPRERTASPAPAPHPAAQPEPDPVRCSEETS